jgi:ligand-binding sensor domain-containing protein/two-component sensor histidine kinase
MTRSLSFAVLASSLAVLLSGVPLWGLDPGKPPLQYSQAVWQVADGLPDNFVQALLQTRDGYLWLGTNEGLVRFDGMQFTVYDTRSTPALRHNSVVTLCEDRTGALWIGTSGGGITVYRDGRFVRTYDTSNGLPNNYIRSIYEDREGTIWITAHGGGLVSLRDGKFHAMTTRDGLPSNSLRTVFQDASGSLWIGTEEDGVCVMRGTSLRCFGFRDGLRSTQIRAFHQDRQGRIWVGTRAGGLHTFEEGRFRPVKLTPQIPGGAVRAILEDRHGNLWVGTEGAGLIRIRGGEVARLTARQGLPHNFVRALLEDREGNLWVGTRGGLFRLRDRKVQTWTTTEGLVSDDVRTLLAEPSGRVWIGTRAGLSLLDRGRVRTIRLSREWSRDTVRTLARASDGSIWVGADTGLFRWKNDSVVRVALPIPGHPGVRVLLAGRGGRMWIGLWDRLLLCEGGRCSDITARLGLPPQGINALAEDRQGTLWVGTEQGLIAVGSHGVSRFSSRNGLSHDRVTCLYLDKENALWIGTRGGLTRLKDGRFSVFRQRHGLLSDNILHVAEDRHGYMWLTSRRGIMRIRKQELLDFAEGRIAELHPVVFDTSDGMKSAECNGDAHPAGAITPDGRMWFPTVAGVVVFDPANLRAASAPPRVLIERVVAGQKSCPATSAPVRVPAGTENLEIEFTAISLSAPERVRFRYRLEGYDAGWTETRRRRSAWYTHLPPGSYRFRVLADAYDGSWPKQEASLDLVIEPRFYQTAWFYLLCVGSVAGLAWLVYRARMLAVRERYEAVLRERLRIAREIHDTLMQGVTGVSLQLETAARRLPSDPGEAKVRMDRALTRLDQVLAEARRTICELRASSLLDQDPGCALQELVRDVAADHAIQVEFRVEGRPRPVPPHVCAHLVSIAREAVFNAIRHSGASRLHLLLKYERGGVRLLAMDDGRGFDATRLSGAHFGLTGMQERARSAGGTLTIHSRPGEGTKVEVELPLKAVS